MSITSVDTDYDHLTVTLVSDFDASVEQVWELWSDPRKLERWWGPPAYPATFEKHDLIQGGVVTYFMTGPEGDRWRGMWRVTAVEPPTSLEFTDAFADADGTPITDLPVYRVSVRLREHENGTRMEMRSKFESREDLERWLGTGTLEGQQQAVAQMDALLGLERSMHRPRRTADGLMTTVEANGVKLGVERFGEATAPLVLLAGGTTMLSWPDALCEALARGGRHVVRYDLRDSGASTTVDPDAPAYTLRDLAADAAALARVLDDPPAHLAGIGVGGMVAQVAALDHPDAFSALTLAGTRPVAPGPPDDDLPDHDPATMDRLFSHPMPDWSDRAAVAEFAAAGAEALGDDPAAARATAERIWDRTPSTEPAVQMANQMGVVFSKIDCKPRWRERLAALAIPALVVHGRRDPFFPVGNGEALAREIPGARLLVLEQAATAIPDEAADEVATAMLELDEGR